MGLTETAGLPNYQRFIWQFGCFVIQEIQKVIAVKFGKKEAPMKYMIRVPP